MKNHLKQFLIVIPLLLIAGASFAAYTFTGPTAAPTANNTEAPLDITGTDQVKNGGLSVNTFQSRSAADFAQQVTFKGLVNGGTVTKAASTISFGDSSHKVSVNNTGNATVAGTLQSDSLKTGGGNKPVCADADGTIYICGAAAAPANTTPIYLRALTESNNGYFAVAQLSEPTNTNLVITIAASVPSTTGGDNAMNFLKNAYTADARAAGVCYLTSTPTDIGTVTILGGNTTSESIPFPSGCDPTEVSIRLSFSSYPHQTQGGRPIIVR